MRFATHTQPTRPRGIALLLVLVALVVGTILTAGFLATQSTANGITRNQKSIGQTRMIAESGVDSCVWLIKNKSDWRRTMTPGVWINNMTINGGTLSVSVTDGAANSSFATDNTQSALIQSTATYNGQSLALQAIVTPSGGGKPWQNGLFVNSGPTMANSSSIDAYNPTLGLYPVSKLLTAIVGTGGSLDMRDFSSVYGTALGAPGNLLTTLLNALFTTPPSLVTTAPEPRTQGTVMPPNVAGFTAAGAFSSNTVTVSQPNGNQTFDSFALVKPGIFSTATMSTAKSAVYYVKGNLSLDVNTVIKVNNTHTVIFYVLGSTDIQGNINLVGTGQFILYTAGNVAIHGASVFNSQTTSGQALILGLPGSTQITLSNTAAVAAGIYAPKAVVTMSNSAVVYGSVISQSVIMQNSAAIHLDDTIKTRVFHQITGGTTQGDYNVTWVRTNGSNPH